MPLLNYSTGIDPDKTAAEIAKCLSQHGAQAVMTEYDREGSFVSALSFSIPIGEQSVSFRLPCDWRPVLEILKNGKYPKNRKTKEQAVRTSWRIVKDWVEAQMALVETQMVKTEQVFLPYAVGRDGKTLGEKLLDNPTFLLGSGE